MMLAITLATITGATGLSLGLIVSPALVMRQRAQLEAERAALDWSAKLTRQEPYRRLDQYEAPRRAERKHAVRAVGVARVTAVIAAEQEADRILANTSITAELDRIRATATDDEAFARWLTDTGQPWPTPDTYAAVAARGGSL